MKTIPAALRAKLLNKIKAESTDSQPNIKVIATQTSYNTLLSEPIHEDIAADYGDVTIRQMEGETEPSLTYSICIDDDGIAKIRSRKLPAIFDYPWETVFTFGEADDVAIEYDGTWTLDVSNQWYYLKTEEYPYIFTVESGALYVQKWNDSSTRVQLVASNVEQIATCKGWHNNIDIEQDQGLIVGYIKQDGYVYYRAYCQQSDGTYMWESEHNVSTLSSCNTCLQIFRTNDFRVGFLTKNNDDIKLTLTDRTYSGMSVTPEVVQVYTAADFSYDEIKNKYGYTAETVQARITRNYFMLDDAATDTTIAVTGGNRLDREETWYSYGVTVILSKTLFYDTLSELTGKISVSKTLAGTTSTVSISSIEYDAETSTITIYFASDIIKTASITVTITGTIDVWYKRLQNQNWPLTTLSKSFESQVRNFYGYTQETVTVSTSASMSLEEATFKNGFENETLTISTTATATLEPASIEPI